MGSPKKDYQNLRYKCQYCFYATNRPSHLKRHYLTHTQERPFTCTVCGKSFNQKVSLQEHSRIHTGEKPFQCDVCFVRFTQRSSLKNHKRLHMKNDTTDFIWLQRQHRPFHQLSKTLVQKTFRHKCKVSVILNIHEILMEPL
ncbi:Zinc finger protein 354B like protein [Argiope bruennichi]|uniref:Zinc finger protein 354B like protein n=1 Tax=Argiope bruennichi TaxID=94029 RepID=A0A8T0E9G6_ARGBR|nr:Zinc finger protein 354B like protein [Argiope bruennichi]